MSRSSTVNRSLDSMQSIRISISSVLNNWQDQSLRDGSLSLLMALGYNSDRLADFPTQPIAFIETLSKDSGYVINADKIQRKAWKSVELLFQITDDEIPSLATGQNSLINETAIQFNAIESFTFIAIELADQVWSRTALTGIVRELNRATTMPLIVLFRYGNLFSLAVISRRVHKRDSDRDVLGSKITVIKDVRLNSPHAAHVHILSCLHLSVLQDKNPISNFTELYAAWLDQLSIKALNERFYKDLQSWYLWARRKITFPKGQIVDEEGFPSVAVIRLLTRLIFVWFIKEKGLVPDDFFAKHRLAELLKEDPRKHPKSSNYYLAILQNLFFATLNVEMNKGNSKPRKWAQAEDAAFQGKQKDRMQHSVYRYQDLFNDPEQALQVFASVPFLNGGLFECLDREISDEELMRDGSLNNRITKEGKGWVLRVDGFSRNTKAQPNVPNIIFFGHGESVDLNEELNTKGKQYTADGLLDIFSRYKFTVDENTPLDEEVALDPELLGKVFENLLASYNEDTKTTARKQSGSFYTPREVVDYMVDEAIIAYVLPKLEDGTPEDNRQKLQSLLSYTESGNPFDEDLTAGVIMTLAELKILDPACGSGAFPMGALNKLVLMLSKLDANNKLWQRQHERRLNEDLAKATKAKNIEEVEALTAELTRLKTNFEQQTAEYTRKLYLIENSIYGVDIQPIAVQIAKLRFFIALIVSQQVDAKKPNRGMLALPNLETRIVAANGLQPLSDKGQAVMDSDALRALRKQLIEQQSHYFRANDRQKKKTAQNKIELLQTEIQKECFLLGYGNMSARLLSFHPFDQNSSSQFFEPNIMFGFDKFNMVIGNPPYVRQESIKHLKDQFKKNYACFTGVADLYVYFYERSFDLLEPNGSFAFITSNKWYRANYGAKLREWMQLNTRIHQVIDFGDEAVFTALAYPTIVIATKREQVKQPADHELIKVLNWDQSTNPNIFDFPRIFAKHHFNVQQASLQPKGWQLEPQGKRDVLARLRAAGKPLGEYVKGQFYRGITTGLNEAFVIDGATRAQLIEKDAKSAEIIKPFLRGRDIKRWVIDSQDLWLIYIPWHFPLHLDPQVTGASKEAEVALKNQYPAIYEHLMGFKDALSDRNQAETGVRYEWYALQRWGADYWREFSKEKIVFPDIATSPQFTWESDAAFLGNTAYFITDVCRSMVAILNSHVSTWFYAQISPQIQNGYFRFIAQYVEQIPIPEATAHQKYVLETLVDEIMISKERPKLESLMNALVYQLFFPEEFKAAGINLFQTCTQIGLLNCSDNPDFQKTLATIHSFPIVQTIEYIIATPKDSQA